MDIDGKVQGRKSEPITLQLMQNQSQQFKGTPGIDVYINAVLEQQQDTYGYVSKVEKHQAKLNLESLICDKLKETSWVKAKQCAEKIEKQKKLQRMSLKDVLELDTKELPIVVELVS